MCSQRKSDRETDLKLFQVFFKNAEIKSNSNTKEVKEEFVQGRSRKACVKAQQVSDILPQVPQVEASSADEGKGDEDLTTGKGSRCALPQRGHLRLR
jgi:hypothetical protein